MLSSFSDLYRTVIDTKTGCAGCGICVMVCPHKKLVLKDGLPEQLGETKDFCEENSGGRCGLCARACPRFAALTELNGQTENHSVPFLRMVVARSRDSVFQEKGQNGGLVSAILKWGLENDKWKSCVTYAHDKNWRTVPRMVTQPEEILDTCGSKYTYHPFMESLKNLAAANPYNGPFALVGLPCHLAAVRRLQDLKSKYVKGLVLNIGLFCSESFTYQGLIEEKIGKEMDIDIQDVKKMDIRKGSFIIEMSSGQNYQIPLKEISACTNPGCGYCGDFAAEQADISVGGLGIEGWTVAIVRDEVGEKVIKSMTEDGCIEVRDPNEFPKALGLLERMSAWKRQWTVSRH